MTKRARLVALASIAALTLGPVAGMATAEAKPGNSHSSQGGGKGKGKGKPIMVMTRNLYLGADIQRPVDAAVAAQAAGKTPAEVMVALANATHTTRAIVDQTNFPVRAALLADEIKRTKPDLIGLQEVALWRSGPLETGAVGVPNATTVDYDFLQILLAELEERGAKYRTVIVGARADVEGPSFTGSPFDGTMGGTVRDVRLTMHDVILKRANNSLKVTSTVDKVYANNLSVPVAGTTINFARGYQYADVKAGGRSLRFVNTHLEAFSSNLAYAQASQMLAESATSERATIMVCDCNSDPLNSTVKAHDTLPHKAAYDLIVSKGFTDQWLTWAPAAAGWTSGLSEQVNDATAAGFDHRIDMIFGRTAKGDSLRIDKGRVTGTSLDDRDEATGLWPSDHAGVVLRVRSWR